MGKYSTVGFINTSGEKRSKRRHLVNVIRDDDGTVAGTQTEHDSGRVDAVAFAKVVKTQAQVGVE